MNASNEQIDELYDNMLVDISADALRERLKEQRESGKHGWFSNIYTTEQLEDCASYKVNEHDYLDAAAYMLMAYMRENHIDQDIEYDEHQDA